MDELRRGLLAYLRQQAEWNMPDCVLASGLAASLGAAGARRPVPAAAAPSVSYAPRVPPAVRSPVSVAPSSAPSAPGRARPRPLRSLASVVAAASAAAPAAGPRREALKALYYEVKACAECPLAERRKSMVFGSGNAEAENMVIGAAPGADEDEQGLPFVGSAGKLLTEMLTAIGLDRTRDVFITNVLKCRPPQNRDPESMEVVKCMPILRRQIAAIRPRVLLLLGRVAAGAVLGSAESVGALRVRTHAFEGIPAFVTYHPAALLRSAEYKRPAWEDLKRFAAFLTEQGIRHGSGS